MYEENYPSEHMNTTNTASRTVNSRPFRACFSGRDRTIGAGATPVDHTHNPNGIASPVLNRINPGFTTSHIQHSQTSSLPQQQSHSSSIAYQWIDFDIAQLHTRKGSYQILSTTSVTSYWHTVHTSQNLIACFHKTNRYIFR